MLTVANKIVATLNSHDPFSGMNVVGVAINFILVEDINSLKED